MNQIKAAQDKQQDLIEQTVVEQHPSTDNTSTKTTPEGWLDKTQPGVSTIITGFPHKSKLSLTSQPISRTKGDV